MGLDSAFDIWIWAWVKQWRGHTGAGRAGFGRKISTGSMDFPWDHMTESVDRWAWKKVQAKSGASAHFIGVITSACL